VTFRVEQVWKSSTISWISTGFTDVDFNAYVCPKKNEVSPGFVNYASDGAGAYELKNYAKTYGQSLRAKCANGFATVEIYVHDGQFNGQPSVPVPDACSPSCDASKKIGYRFSVPCNACVPRGSTSSPVKAPTKAPAKIPTNAPVRPPTKAPAKAPTSAPAAPALCPATQVGSALGEPRTMSSTPIKIVSGSQRGSTVQFQIEQVWKDSAVSWLAIDFLDNGSNRQICPKMESVSPGLVNVVNSSCGGNSQTFGFTLTARCVSGFATVSLYVHDGQFARNPNINSAIPDRCSPSTDMGKKIGYTYSLPCSCP
jgi:hypothetical protein